MGELIYETRLETGRNTVQLNVSKGTYLAHIISEKGVVVKRLVIE
jgi:hypothetical protein